MKIKTKLSLNVLIVAAISVTISATCYFAMTFIKEKLAYLTEKSTPFQIRTLELQRSAQGATVELVKIGAAKTRSDLAALSGEAQKSLESVRKSQEALEQMSAEKYDTLTELTEVHASLTKTMEGNLRAGEEVAAADQALAKRLKEAIGALAQLDSRVKALQLTSSANYATSVEDHNTMSEKQTGLATAKAQLTDIMVVVLHSQRGRAKFYRSQAKALMDRVKQNGSVRSNQKIRNEVATLAAKTEEYFTARIAGDTAKADGMIADVSNGIDTLVTLLGMELEQAHEKMAIAGNNQGTSFTTSSVAVNALASNAELVAAGTAVDGLATRLMNVTTVKDVDLLLAQINALYAKIHKASVDLDRHLRKMKANRELGNLRSAAASFASIHAAITAGDGIAAKIKKKIELDEVAARETVKLRDIVVKLAEKGKQTEQAAQGEQEKSIASVNGMIRKSLILILGIGGGSVLLGIVFGFWMYRAIANPISALVKTAREIASGNLSCSLAVDSKDEIGEVQTAMAEMVVSLEKIAKKIGLATNSLASSAEELSCTATSLANVTEEQTVQIQQSATAMAEMSQTITDVACNANSTAETAASMKETALGGKAMLHEAVEEFRSFADTMKASATKIEQLREKSQEISGIIALINDIADQTNLLALNAAIEAARAGEMGRGFSVVAGEVKKLAEKTNEATSDIVRGISEMQLSVDDSIELIRRESSGVDKVVATVHKSVESIDTIVEDMAKVSEMVARIAVAAEQQSATSSEISSVMTGIADAAEEVKSAFADVKSSSQSLSGTAADLNESAKWFRFDKVQKPAAAKPVPSFVPQRA